MRQATLATAGFERYTRAEPLFSAFLPLFSSPNAAFDSAGNRE